MKLKNIVTPQLLDMELTLDMFNKSDITETILALLHKSIVCEEINVISDDNKFYIGVGATDKYKVQLKLEHNSNTNTLIVDAKNAEGLYLKLKVNINTTQFTKYKSDATTSIETLIFTVQGIDDLEYKVYITKNDLEKEVIQELSSRLFINLPYTN